MCWSWLPALQNLLANPARRQAMEQATSHLARTELSWAIARKRQLLSIKKWWLDRRRAVPRKLASPAVNRNCPHCSRTPMKSLTEIDNEPITGSIVGRDSFPGNTQRPTLRVVAVLEGSTVSGPAKNLFEFCRAARTLSTGTVVDLTLVAFHRSLSLDCSQNTDLIDAARQADIDGRADSGALCVRCPGGFPFAKVG